MNNIITVAIDGESSSGKGTIAKLLAQELHYAYLDTGLLYRAVAYLAQKEGALNNIQRLVSLAKTLDITKLDIMALKQDDIAQIASAYVAKEPSVRQALLQYQRKFALYPKDASGIPLKGAILDGRDIGTVILPQATIKFFIEARLDVRAKRRYEELRLANPNITLEGIAQSLAKRDEADKGRKHGALKKAQDALIIDTSDYTVNEVLAIALKYIKERLKNKF